MLVELCCKKIAESGKIGWFGAREAKLFCRLYRFQRVSFGDLCVLTGINCFALKEMLSDFAKRKLASFDGEKYFLENPLGSLNSIVSLAERDQILLYNR